jgi:hypothetical protein
MSITNEVLAWCSGSEQLTTPTQLYSRSSVVTVNVFIKFVFYSVNRQRNQ